jgi:hypothetical protein
MAAPAHRDRVRTRGVRRRFSLLDRAARYKLDRRADYLLCLRCLGRFERALMRERTFAGLAAVRERGATGDRRPDLDDAKLARARALIGQGLRATEAVGRLKLRKSALYQALK